MQIQINGEPREVDEGLSLQKLVELMGLRSDQVAVELNHLVLRRRAWEETTLRAGDRVEIVHFVGGGCE